jgi:signal transduction histidine kinase
MIQIPFCSFDPSKFLVISDNVPPLVYYSHIPIIIASLVIGIYVFLKNYKALPNRLILVTTLTFSFWVFMDSIFWASNRGDVIMFVWAMQILVEPLVHLSALYLLYVLVYKRDVSFRNKLLMFILYVPVLIFAPTRYFLTSFDVGTCLSQESLFSYYSYLIEVIYSITLVAVGVKKFFKETDVAVKKEIVFLTVGMIIMLVSFSWGAITGSFTEDWNLAQYGLFGMPVFIGLLSYSIVKFRLFDLKLVGSNVLVIALWVMTASLLFIQDIGMSHNVTWITLIISVFFGIILIKSVKKEILQREKIESLASDLKSANTRLLSLDKQKSEFVSIATHQLRAPLTAMKGYTSLILEGDFGEINKETKQAVSRIYDSANTLTNIVNDYLNISRIELGTMKYNFTTLDLKELVDNVIGELRPNIEKKGLKLSFTTTPDGVNTRFMIHADKDKLKQVVANLVDNSIKYTPSGSIDISIVKNTLERKVTLSIRDTGVGISKDVMPKLFAKFVRAESANKQNIYGTGLGLYIAKQIVDAHKGHIKAISDGDGMGSTFYVVFDMEV